MTNYDGAKLCGVSNTEAVAVQMCRWPRPDVTWAIVSDIPGLDRASFMKAAVESWKRWSDVCGIQPRMVEAANQANVIIGIQTIGPGGVLADSEIPCGASMQTQLRQRYDSAEDWVISDNPPSNKIDLVRVMTHEIGHVIGIYHIGSGNLMAPTYSTRINKPVAGDIAEAVARYGLPAPVAPVDPTPPIPGGDYQEIAALLQKGNDLFIRRNGVVRPL